MHHLMNKKERTNKEIIRTFQKIFTCHLKKVRKIFTELHKKSQENIYRVTILNKVHSNAWSYRKKSSKFVVFETEEERAAITQKIMKKNLKNYNI